MAKKRDLGDASGGSPVPTVRIEADPGAILVDGGNLVPAKKMAENLGVSGKTLGRLVKGRQIPAVRIGDAWRFDPVAVRRSIQEKAATRAAPRGITREAKRRK